MIVSISGKVSYSITLDPSVWIFDERKVLLEEAFNNNKVENIQQEGNQGDLKKVAKNYDRAILNPPINQGLTKREGEEILKNSYVMPIHYFLKNAGVQEDASTVTLLTNNENEEVDLKQFYDGYFLFSIEGKPLEDGPVHFLYKDGSNKENPIKNIKKIIIK